MDVHGPQMRSLTVKFWLMTTAVGKPFAAMSGIARPERLNTSGPSGGANFLRYLFTARFWNDGRGKTFEKPPPEPKRVGALSGSLT